MSTRQIKDAVNHSTGELVYFKGHAKATFMSDGKTVEEAINNIEIPTVPTKVSELENDSKFITIDEVPEVTVPTKVSDLTNDSGFITINDVPVLEIPEEYVTETELNDKGFLTEHQDISHLASRNWVETQGYAHQEDLLEISFNDIQDSPIHIDDSGMINFVDESGNVGFQINEEGLRVTDVIAGEHKLSEKANVSDIPSLDGYVKTEDIPSLDGLVKSEDLPNFDEFAKTEDIPSLDNYASKEWVNNKNYATEYELKTIDYSSINNVPVSDDETGELNITDESGNIGMKVASEAVYAKDFVAGGHKLSEKVDKTYVDNSIAELVDGAPETLDTLNELSAALKDNADIVDVLNQSIGNKQDVITDLETIRQGAAKGATAVQSISMSVATGSVTAGNFFNVTKDPSTGNVSIQMIQNSLASGKIAIPYTTDVKQYIDNAVANAGGGGTGGSGIPAYREINHGTNETTITIMPNEFHVWDEVSDLTIAFEQEMPGYASEYLFQFTSGATPATLTLPDNIKFTEDLAIEANKIYQISILKGFGSVLEFGNAQRLIRFYVKLAGDWRILECPPNMTWYDYVNSEYNTGQYILAINGNKITYSLFAITNQTPSDTIIDGQYYDVYLND